MSFVVFYIIVSTLLVASAIRIFNATLLESSELDATELKLYKLGTVENIRDSLGYERENSSFHRGEASRVNDEGASHAEVVLGVLAHVGVLDHHRDIEPWLKVRSYALIGYVTMWLLTFLMYCY